MIKLVVVVGEGHVIILSSRGEGVSGKMIVIAAEPVVDGK